MSSSKRPDGRFGRQARVEIDGVPIIDAETPLEITINSKDITSSARRDPGECALVTAIKRKLHAEEVRVHISRTYIRTGNQWTRYETPPSLRAEIIAFDRGGNFIPGKHTFPPVKACHRYGARKPTKKKGFVRENHWIKGIRRAGIGLTVGVRPNSPKAAKE